MTANPRASRDFNIVLALGAVASTVVCLRFLARRLCKASLFVDDYIIVASLGVMFGFVTDAGILVFNGGIGKKITELTPSEYTVYFRAGLASEILYSLNISLTKVSILFLYGRLFPIQRLLLIAKIIGGVVASWCLTGVLVTIFQCHPISGAWLPSPESHCIAYFNFQIWISIVNTLTDFIILCLPLHMIWRLSLPARQKVVLSCIFLLGSFVFIASIMRIITLRTVDPLDLPYTVLPGATWSLIEAELAITCACLPTLRPLVSNTEWMKRTKNRISVCSHLTHVSRTSVKPSSLNDRIISIGASDNSAHTSHHYTEVTDFANDNASLADRGNPASGRTDLLDQNETAGNHANFIV